MEKILLTPEEAAEVLNIGRDKVYKLIRTGELASVKIGKSRRVPTDAVHQLVRDLAAKVGA